MCKHETNSCLLVLALFVLYTLIICSAFVLSTLATQIVCLFIHLYIYICIYMYYIYYIYIYIIYEIILYHILLRKAIRKCVKAII